MVEVYNGSDMIPAFNIDAPGGGSYRGRTILEVVGAR